MTEGMENAGHAAAAVDGFIDRGHTPEHAARLVQLALLWSIAEALQTIAEQGPGTVMPLQGDWDSGLS